MLHKIKYENLDTVNMLHSKFFRQNKSVIKLTIVLPRFIIYKFVTILQLRKFHLFFYVYVILVTVCSVKLIK